MNCRVCLEHIIFQEAVGNLCNCKEVYFHKSCAEKWFTPRITGTSKGKAVDNNWDTKWHALCEVCNHNIDDDFVKQCVSKLKIHSLRKMYKSENPIVLPNVPVISAETTQNYANVRTHPVSVQITHRRPLERTNNVSNSNKGWFFSCFSQQNETPTSTD